jgi:opacity protein-like surface antigen
MKRLATTIAAIALIGTPAFAADLAVKAPPPAPAPVYNWTGWYAGVNAGASFGNVKPTSMARLFSLAVSQLLPALVSPIENTPPGSSAVVKSATIGSIPL